MTERTTVDIIRELERTRDETLRHFALDATSLDRSYGPGKWNVRYLLNHLSDSECVFLYRLKRVLSQGHQVVYAYDQDAWAKALDYSQTSLELAQRLYETSREAIIDFARRYYDRSAQYPFVHSETGLRTLRDEIEKVVWHNDKHLKQIGDALLG